jgi:Kef-type K+ transport system membrane component KefB
MTAVDHRPKGITWAFTFAIMSLAFVGKFVGCTTAARFSGFSWREASAIGSLMSCKGYVDKASVKLSFAEEGFHP